MPDYRDALKVVANMPEEYQRELTNLPLVGDHLPRMIELCKEEASKL